MLSLSVQVAFRAEGDIKHTAEGRAANRQYGRTEADLPKDKSALNEWKDLMKQLQHPASSALEAYLLDNDDPRVVSCLCRVVAAVLSGRCCPCL